MAINGRTICIDPNPANNKTVNIEDLSIIVDLKTRKKGRSVLDVGENQAFITTSSSQSGSIGFIDGTDFDGKKLLTNRYTNITTEFNNENQDLEGLGISDINISFNSMYAPVVKINMVDVRGSSLFEPGNNSKYNVFFELPYPIFELTVKGYYGRTVKYCLHLVKWNSKFNSATGNFEIQCEFIGYTYAILSDMLIGYLKAIVETPAGRNKMAELKSQDPNLLTINELLLKVEDINKKVNKVKKNDADVKELAQSQKLRIDLINLKDIINSYIGSMTGDVFNDEGGKEISNSAFNTNTGLFAVWTDGSKVETQENLTTRYKNDIGVTIEEINKKYEEGFKLQVNDFNEVQIYPIISLQDILDENEETLSLLSRGYDLTDDDDENEYLDFVATIKNALSGRGNPTTRDCTIYDLRTALSKIKDENDRLESEEKEIKEAVGGKLEDVVAQILGNEENPLNPNIRNIFKILSTHIEIFLERIYEVAEAAEGNGERKKALDKIFTNLDINATEVTTNETSTSLPQKYYAFPEFRKNGKEEWIGNDAPNIPEVILVEEILAALLKVKAEDNALLSRLNNQTNTNDWFPINPLDTKIFREESAYQEIGGENQFMKMLRVMSIRGLTYLGHTNRDVTDQEVIAMAELEAEHMFNNVVDQTNKDLISNFGGVAATAQKDRMLDSLKNGDDQFELPDGNKLVIFETGDYYVYKYMDSNGNKKVVPIDGKMTGAEFFNGATFKPTNELANVNDVYFLSDYSRGGGVKPNDGATYMKIINMKQYGRNSHQPTYGDNSISVLQESLPSKQLHEVEIQKLGRGYIPTDVGFEPYAGVYKTQEYIYGNFTRSPFKVAPSIITFYSPGDEDTTPMFANVREKREKDTDYVNRDGSTKYDIFPDNDKIRQYKSLGVTRLGINLGSDSGIYRKETGKSRKHMDLLVSGKRSQTAIPWINFYYDDPNTLSDDYPVPVFGSDFYYGQYDNEKAKAFIFLHSMPWLGLIDFQTTVDAEDADGIFLEKEILGMFSERAGYIQAPKAWCAFVGALLWRYESTTDPIRFEYDGKSLIPEYASAYPTKDRYLTDDDSEYSLYFNNGNASSDFTPLSDTLKDLPRQIKDEFIAAFDTWVNDTGKTGWQTIKNALEIWETNNEQDFLDYRTAWSGITFTTEKVSRTVGGGKFTAAYASKSQIVDTLNFKNLDNYVQFSKIVYGETTDASSTFANVDREEQEGYHTIFLEIRDNTSVRDNLLDFVSEPVMIMNASYRPWNSTSRFPDASTNTEDISVKKSQYDLYLTKFFERFTKLNDTTERLTEKDKLKSEIFNTINDDKIKLNIYRTLKSIHDKWIGGSNGEFFHQCGEPNELDKNIAAADGRSTPRLIDSYRFVNRAYNDIGEQFLINPAALVKELTGNFNQSYYDVTARILADNNFDFIPLPTFINFRTEDELRTMFDTLDYNKGMSAGQVGPAFVCVYVGQTSNKLDLGSDHPNDGIDIRCDENGNLLGLPEDFASDTKRNESGNPIEHNIPVFEVNYGDQNQSIFKDIKLDQSEFSETDESLKVIDDIANRGSETNQSYAGQNLFNVYQIRSYAAEIEMLGNAMIQPMMYFQLNNIPMFHGAYMILNVSHNIKPNHMTTKFKGVRVRRTDTPLIEGDTLFMTLLGSLTEVDTEGATIGDFTANPYNITDAKDNIIISST